MRRTVLSSVACPDRPRFSTQCYKRHDLGNVIDNKLFMSIFSTTLSEIFIIVRSIQRDIVFVHKRRRVNCPSYCQILMKLESTRLILEKSLNTV